MSRIYFHEQTYGSAEVSGSDRAHFGWTCSQMMLLALSGTLDEKPDYPSPFRKILPPDHYILSLYPVPVTTYSDGYAFEKALKTALRAGFDLKLSVNGDKVDPFTLGINTALVAGSDPIKLGARLHAQCEIHGYIAPRNGEWFAGIIEQGVKMGFLRYARQWAQVCQLLRVAKGRVVTSYSVCETFPNRHIARQGTWRGTDDEWYELESDRRWDLAMDGLVKRNETGQLEIKPDNWDTFYIADGWNGYTLARYLSEQDKGGE